MGIHNNKSKESSPDIEQLDNTELTILIEIGRGKLMRGQLVTELARKVGISESEMQERFATLVDAGFIESGMNRPCLRPSALSALNADKTDARGSSVLERYADTTLHGTVTSGLGEGKHFVGLSGYKRQFQEKLGYTPYPGTLNIELDDKSAVQRRRLDVLSPIWIEGWNDKDQEFGPAICHPATITTDTAGTYKPAHMIFPFRTEHDSAELELLAPDNLRETIDLNGGQMVEVSTNEL